MRKQQFFYHTLRGTLLGSRERERLVLEVLKNIKPHESFLDVGCASGHYVERMLGRCLRCVGIDMDRQDIELAKMDLPHGEFYCEDATSLSRFRKSEFDWVLCSEVLEHVPNWKNALAEVKRVCRGNAVFTIPLEKGVFWRTASALLWKKEMRGHVHELGSGDIEHEMLADGNDFELAEKRYVFAPMKWLNTRFAESKNEKWAMYAVLWFKKWERAAKSHSKNRQKSPNRNLNI